VAQLERPLRPIFSWVLPMKTLVRNTVSCEMTPWSLFSRISFNSLAFLWKNLYKGAMRNCILFCQI
jgi:hypothetical protein